MTEELDQDALDFAHQMFDLARSGETEQLAAYVDAGLPVNLTNDKGDTLLILAAYHDHPGTVRALLDRGADTTRANDRGQTALAAAVFRQSKQIVAALLAAGADPALGSPSAVDTARFFGLPEMLALLDAAAPGPRIPPPTRGRPCSRIAVVKGAGQGAPTICGQPAVVGSCG